ncbi:MAG: class I mannose-6-phosphate isomerase [Bacteroidales bacterium]|nr:class I mannose-6-phosphate isomerase [Bacteroidales bacterium]
MFDDKKLYPFKFIPVSSETPWGGDRHAIADLGYIDSMVDNGWLGGNTLAEVMQTYLERVVGETAFEWYGTQFPVLVKFLTVRGRTSLHVNPDDRTAEERYDAFGKTALWYVTEAGEDARLWMGFGRDVSPTEFYEKCLAGTVEDLLNVIRPVKGESYLIPPGLVHGASGSLSLVEVSECSDLFFRVHDWGRGERETHLEEAFDLIDFRPWDRSLRHGASRKEGRVTERLAATPAFTVTEFTLSDPVHIFSEEERSFQLYACLHGAAMAEVPSEDGRSSERYPVKAGEVLLVPAEVHDFFLVPSDRDTLLLETILEPRVETDSYTGEDARDSEE